MNHALEFDDENWRSEIDSNYEREYEEYYNSTSKLNFTSCGVTNKFLSKIDEKFESIKFPPNEKLNLPSNIPIDIIDIDEQLTILLKEKKLNNEVKAGIEFLEAMLKTVFEKSIFVRNSLLENGRYIYVLPNPPEAHDASYLKTTVLQNLIKLKDETSEILNDLGTFTESGFHEIIDFEEVDYLDKPVLEKVKYSINQRSIKLRTENSESLFVIENLVMYTNALLAYPDFIFTKLDGIQIDWTRPAHIEEKIESSNRALNYAKYMNYFDLPVCDAVYEYLQSPSQYSNQLTICDYSFQEEELSKIFDFFEIQQHFVKDQKKFDSLFSNLDPSINIFKSIRGLILHRCNLYDKDLYTVFPRFTYLLNLENLVLSDNHITYSGLTSLLLIFFENQFKLRLLHLDNNNISEDGAKIIGEVLAKLPFLESLSLSGNPIKDKGLYYILKGCMNPIRKAFKSLPKPTNKLSEIAASSNSSSSQFFVNEEKIANLDDSIDESEDEDNGISQFSSIGLTKKASKSYYFDEYFKTSKKSKETEVFNEKNQNKDKMNQDWDDNLSDLEIDIEEASNYSNEDLSAYLSDMKLDSEFFDLERAKGTNKKQDQADTPKLVIFFLKIRIKLVAINSFLRFLRKGSILTHLDVSDCCITYNSISTICHALLDNTNIIQLNISDNPELFKRIKINESFQNLLEKGSLQTIKLNNCGIRDSFFMKISSSISKSPRLINVELSDNYIGPTGANNLAKLNKTFYTDDLVIGTGFHSTAPFPRKGYGYESSLYEDFDEEKNFFDENSDYDSENASDKEFDDRDQTGDGYDDELAGSFDEDDTEDNRREHEANLGKPKHQFDLL